MPRAIRFLLLAIIVSLTAPVVLLHAQVSVWTYHNDNSRQGANTNETILTTANVNTNSFGKLFTYAVNGYIYTQPLYMPNVAITNKGTHNVVFVGTEADTLYAFDADSNTGSNSTALWQTNLLALGETTLNTNDVNTTDVTPQVGITGTPVIDTNTDTLYVVSKSKLVSGGTTNFFQRLHALDITSGAERPNSPVLIAANYPGTGEGSSGGVLPFSAKMQHQRSGLLLLNGVVYIIWASHGDNSPYHGWLMGYDELTLQRVSVYNTTPNGIKGGIWHAGCAPVADTNGNIYFVTGNGTFDVPTNNDYGDSIIRLATTNAATNLFLADYFTPYNQYALGGVNGHDTDLGSGGAMLLPDSVGNSTNRHLLVDAGKGRTIYLINTTNMGHFNSATQDDHQIVQSIVSAVGGVVLSTPAYFNNRVYYMSYKDVVKAFSVGNGLLSTTPISQSSLVSGIFGATPSISANGTNNAICWIVLVEQYNTGGPAVLHAYDAYTLSTELYNSSLAGTRDTAPAAVKFTVPTVVNGKVYVGGQASLVVYGNAGFSGLPAFTAQPQSQTVPAGTNVTFSVGIAGTNAVTVQWLLNGGVIPGATSTNFVINNVQITDAGLYSVVASNVAGTNLSSQALLSVIAPMTNYPGAVLAPTGLVNWWPADGNAIDIFGANNGTLQNGSTYGPGISGQAFQFNGVDSYVQVGAPNLTPPWTMCCWVNRQNGITNSTVIMGDGTYYIKLEQYNNTHQVGITQLGYKDTPFSYIVPTNTWTHLAFVATSTQVTLYANGVSQGSITTNNFPLPRSYIGAGFASPRFIDFALANIDEIQTFNRALSAAEVANIASAGSAGMYRVPQFTNVMQTNGGVNVGLAGQTGKTFTLYTSTNLTNWSPLTTLPNPTGATNYTDTTATNGANFYRASQP